MPELKLFHEYTRRQVHDIFSPNSSFKEQTGAWGISGIVRIDKSNNYVFFVSLGCKQAHHSFKEGITRDGMVYWQSQPGQKLTDKQIQTFIHHNELSNAIHLFFRSTKGGPYTYLGCLAYVTHDPNRDKPVYFIWRILDWKPTEQIVQNLKIRDMDFNIDEIKGYCETPQLKAYKPRGKQHGQKSQFMGHVKINRNFLKDTIRNKEIGDLGEDAVYQIEKHLLIAAGKSNLAEKMYLTRDREGNTAPYDIHSFYPNGQDKYIEVKTTVTNDMYSFFISKKELEFFDEHKKSYLLYRIYDFDKVSGHFSYFTVDNIRQFFAFEPYAYKTTLGSS